MIRVSQLFMGFLILLSACNKTHFYSDQKLISDSGWSYADTLTYLVDITDTLTRYDIGIEVEHSTDFAYQNLYIKILTQFPDGHAVSQTLPIDLADHTGVWYGQCSGSRCETGVELQQNARFDQLGQHTFKLIQYMREDPVNGLGGITFFLDGRDM